MECKEETNVAKENLISVEREDGQVRMTLAESVLKFVAGLFKADPKAPEGASTEGAKGTSSTEATKGTSFNSGN